MPHHLVSREFICDALGLAALSVTTAVMLYMPSILQS